VIARIEGVLERLEPTRIVVDVSGVGYELHIPLSTFAELPDLGKTVVLQVHSHARDGAIELFGFASLAEKKAFQLLLRASRVGPRLAQTVLSGIAPERLVEAIRGGEVAPLRAVPGVGSKMAQRLIVELRDRVDDLAGEVGLDGDTTQVRGAAVAGTGDAAREQTLSALLNLGYPRSQAEQVIEDAAREVGADVGLEPLVRAALRRLSR
jgi:Holliday junction DNA helicase RuvA